MWFSAFTRRQFLSHSAAVAFASLVPKISMAKNATEQKLHGLSAFGDLKYPPDYTTRFIVLWLHPLRYQMIAILIVSY